MRRVVFMFLISNAIQTLFSQDTIFFENFDDYPGEKPPGWTTELEFGDSKWEFVFGGGTKTPAIPGSRKPPNSYSDSVNALYFYQSLGHESVILITPPINLIKVGRPELRFQHAQLEGNLGPGLAHDELRVYYKTHFDSSWSESRKIGEYIDVVSAWREQTIIIPEAAFISTCYFGFKATTNYGWGVCIDDVCIYDTHRDVGVVSIESPITGCSQDIGDHVAVTIKNYGLDTLMVGDTIIVGYDFDEKPTVIESFLLENNILKNETFQYTFKKILSVITSGTKEVKVFTLLPDDIRYYYGMPTNDTLSKSIDIELTPFVFLPTVIYTVRPDTVVLDAYTGNPDDDYLWQDTSTDSVFHVTKKADGIYHVTVSNALCEYRDTTYINYLIADAGVIKINQPVSDCELGNSVQIGITIKNFGTDTMHIGDQITVGYVIDSEPSIEEVIVLDNLVYPDSTFKYVFSTSADFSAKKTYILKSYTVLINDDSTFNDTTTVSIEVYGTPEAEQICIVTVDLETNKNLIVWEKSPDERIAFYNIYRETNIAGQYVIIGTKPYNELSVFTDTTSQPEIKSHKYRISIVDTCGNESSLSPYHKTIILTSNLGINAINLSWTEYVVEDGGSGFVKYLIYRSNDPNNLAIIDSIASDNTLYSDYYPPDGTLYYRIAGVKAEPCYPTGGLKAGSGPYRYSISNIEDNMLYPLAENQAPTDMNLDSSTIDENMPVHTLIGRFTTTDPDLEDTHFYSFVSGTGDTDNGHFIVTGDSLLSGEVFDYETKNNYSIRISTTDTGDLSFEKQLTITINDVYDPVELSGSITDSSNISCYGLNDGTAIVSVSGGLPPYAYLWDDDANSTTQNVTGLVANRWYHVTISDQNMQTVIDSVYLTEPDPIIISKKYTQRICSNTTNGYIILDVTGGIQPYSLNWSTGETSHEINNLDAGKYKVTITDANGCITVDSTQIDSIFPYQDEEICLITVNSQNQIIIVWEKTYGKGTAYYNIYRRQSGNIYSFIDSVKFNDMSIYIDESALPQEQSFYYKINAVDSCGQESELSPYHKSIHMWTAVGVNGEVTLNWNNYEGYEYTDFEIFRGTDQMQMSSVRTITSDARSWTDPNIPTGKVYYQVAAIKSIPCIPTQLKSDLEFESARSNLDDNGFTGVIDQNMNNGIIIYPNPFCDQTTIHFLNPRQNKYQFVLFDITGKIIKTYDDITGQVIELGRDDLPTGLYIIELRGSEIYRGKILIE